MASIGCTAAERCDEYHGYRCTITDGECMFLIPSSKLCADMYGEGPDAYDDMEGGNEL